MGEAELEKSVRTVYQKDLYGDRYSVNIHIDSDELKNGDQLKITVDKIGNAHTEPVPNSQTQKDLQGGVRYKIVKVVNGFVKWLKEKDRWFIN